MPRLNFISKQFVFAFMLRSGWLIFIFSVPFAFNAHGSARRKIDSIKNHLQSAGDLQQRITDYAEMSELYLSVNPDSAALLANEGLKLSNGETSPEIVGRFYHYLGNVQVTHDSLDKAKDSYLKAESYYKQSKTWNRLSAVYLILGNIFLVKDQLVDALNYYHQGQEIAEQHSQNLVLGEFYLNTGTIYYKAQSYPDALRYYDLAQKSFEKLHDTLNIAMTYSNLGEVYNDMHNLDLAESYTLHSVELLTILNDHADLAEAYMALADIHEKKGDDSSAERYLKMTLDEIGAIGVEYKGPKQITASNAITKLGAFNLKNHDLGSAFNNLHTGLTFARNNNQLSVMADACKSLSELWEQRGKKDSALFYYKCYNDYYRQQINEDNIRVLSYQAAQFEFQQQQKAKEVDDLKAESQRRRIDFIIAVVIGALVIAMIILIFIVILSRNRLRQSDLAKKNLQGELDFRNKELTTYVMYQVKNKEFILKISEKLKNARLTENAEYKKLLREIISEIEMDSNMDSWKEFEIRFQRVHTDFYKKLGEKFQDLSPNELRMCAFLKLNMATKDIASVTYQTPNSIDVARHRLRQKLGLGKDENLVNFLSQF